MRMLIHALYARDSTAIANAATLHSTELAVCCYQGLGLSHVITRYLPMALPYAAMRYVLYWYAAMVPSYAVLILCMLLRARCAIVLRGMGSTGIAYAATRVLSDVPY
eukprot:864785-Rhodomonas_salina.1